MTRKSLVHPRDLQCVRWVGSAEAGFPELLDQRELPHREVWVSCRSVSELAEGIRNMTVRGAPAIGIAAAYGVALASQTGLAAAEKSLIELAHTRPTAVNLFWALREMGVSLRKDPSPRALLAEARRIHEEDIEGNTRMGNQGAEFLESGMGVLTHCNAGALATGGVGTALGVIFMAHEHGKKIHVFVDETRPRLQGAKLTTYELEKVGVPYTLICDNMAASLMAKGRIQACITGADRIARNGDAANKIGTYSVAVNANYHQIPFYVAAPKSTFDLAIGSGAEIPIETRDIREVNDWCGTIYNPGFDVTPARLIRAIFTNHGTISPVTTEQVVRVCGG